MHLRVFCSLKTVFRTFSGIQIEPNPEDERKEAETKDETKTLLKQPCGVTEGRLRRSLYSGLWSWHRWASLQSRDTAGRAKRCTSSLQRRGLEILLDALRQSTAIHCLLAMKATGCVDSRYCCVRRFRGLQLSRGQPRRN